MTVVILAAGASRRMGRQKLLAEIGGRPLIGRVLDATAAWPRVVVASAGVAEAIRTSGVAGVTLVLNDAPERGMNHSLALADAAVAADEPIAVLLGDLPDIDAETIARVLAAYDESVDVVVPRAGVRPGHPVVFGPAARERIGSLGDGDGLHRVRDDPALRRRTIVLDDPGPFADIDTKEQLAARLARD